MMLTLPKSLTPVAVLCATLFITAGCTTTSPIDRPPVNGLPVAGALGKHTVADVAQEAMKSVVSIDTKTVALAPDPYRQRFPFGFFEEGPALRKFEIAGTGTGVIYRTDGFILTNNHVVGKASTIRVTLNDGRTLTGKVVGRDSYTDLAVVKIPASNLPVAKLGSAQQLRPGDFAIAIGSPAGLSNTVTMGIISALGRSLDQIGEGGLIQTDTAINPGNSGGPLLNIDGQVIGINTAIRKDYQNIGFAIPVDAARKVADQLITKGSVAHPYIGIAMGDLNEELNKSLGLAPGTRGVVIARVQPGSPGEEAGLQTGDVITQVDGRPVTTAKDVQQAVKAHQPGDSVAMTVTRNGQSANVKITVGDFPAEAE
jgi:S1-C subfamily serine protease